MEHSLNSPAQAAVCHAGVRACVVVLEVLVQDNAFLLEVIVADRRLLETRHPQLLEPGQPPVVEDRVPGQFRSCSRSVIGGGVTSHLRLPEPGRPMLTIALRSQDGGLPSRGQCVPAAWLDHHMSVTAPVGTDPVDCTAQPIGDVVDASAKPAATSPMCSSNSLRWRFRAPIRANPVPDVGWDWGSSRGCLDRIHCRRTWRRRGRP
jgi:hypothetical protein